MLLRKKDEEYIVLKDGYNKSLIIGFIVTIILTCVFTTTKLWLPDSRNKMTLDVEGEKAFRDTIVCIDKEYLWNKDTQVAQIKFNELCMSENDEKIIVSVKVDKEKEMPITLIKGQSVPEEEGSMITSTDYILQFGMPKDTYYVLFEMSKGGLSYKFMIDYRDFKIEPIVELNENYLVKVDTHKKTIDKLNIQKQTLDEELNNIKKLSLEEQATKKERIQEIELALKKCDADIKVQEHSIDLLKKGE